MILLDMCPGACASVMFLGACINGIDWSHLGMGLVHGYMTDTPCSSSLLEYVD